ncbi:MAG: cytochrome c maturation protein CcmE [Flavobacteriia bacterium]|nr:cytochrome c maturation protein CcmE [Flavobacteriia bacterium]
MKTSHIILLIMIAISIGGILSIYGDASTYVDFNLAEKNMGEKYTVIGELVKDEPVDFNPKNTMLTFTAVDSTGLRRTVYYGQPKPMDFERSEKITMKGFATDSGFVATEILMKCPSKYNEKNRLEGNTDSYSSEF